jgi:antitoxin component of RelBE/YafQ-DinJ toxin-antitoxin module
MAIIIRMSKINLQREWSKILKLKLTKYFKKVGISPSTGIQVFYKKLIEEGNINFLLEIRRRKNKISVSKGSKKFKIVKRLFNSSIAQIGDRTTFNFLTISYLMNILMHTSKKSLANTHFCGLVRMICFQQFVGSSPIASSTKCEY